VNFKQKVYIWFTIALKIWNLIEYYHRKNILNIFIYLYVSFKKITWTCPNSHGNFLIAAQFFAVQSSSSWSCWFQFCSYSGRAVIVYVRELQISSVELRTFRCSFVPQKMDSHLWIGHFEFRISDCFQFRVWLMHLCDVHISRIVSLPFLTNSAPQHLLFPTTHWLKLA